MNGKHNKAFNRWINLGMPIKEINNSNAEIIREYVQDMAKGRYVSGSKKGMRSAKRCLNLRSKLKMIAKFTESDYNKKITNLNYEEITTLFANIREGKFLNNRNEKYKSVGVYAKVFTAFWHWHMKKHRVNGKTEIKDITIDIDKSVDKPTFNYLTEEQFKQLCDNAKYEYKIMMYFMFHTGARSPSETRSIKLKDFTNEFSMLEIKDEYSKTFGRKIKIFNPYQKLFQEYAERKNLALNDIFFKDLPSDELINRYIKRLGNKVLDIGELQEKIYNKQKYIIVKNGLTMYDFRHSGACYWLMRYKSESGLRYRFGWRTVKMIDYYTEFLGFKDTVIEDDLYVDVTKTELENQINTFKEENIMLNEKITKLESEMENMDKIIAEKIKKITKQWNPQTI
jgi:integrase